MSKAPIQTTPKKVRSSTKIEGESKRDAFKRLASSRLENVIDAIRVMHNLGNTTTYEYTKVDIDRIKATIDDAVSNLVKRLDAGKPSGIAKSGSIFD